ncbi:MAG: glycosyltransferase [Paludibacteraceae bacterium]|nr:glycosyltransferase [Paludibacteraceae bacterium]MBQ6984950.1 glycosyltransferase [Paludibacteraceae bacterium]
MFGIFNDNFPPIMDGVGMTAQNYAYWLHEKGYEVSVVTPYAPKSEHIIKAAKYPIYRYPSIPIPFRPPYRLGLPYIAPRFLYHWHRMDFELIHAHCPFTTGDLAVQATRRQQIPLVATFHSKYRQDFEHNVPSKKVVDWMVKKIIRFFEMADEVWIPQAAVEPTLREYGFTGHVEVVENGNDFYTPKAQIDAMRKEMRDELGLLPEDTMLLFVGQHIWEKNIGFILDALSLIKDKPFQLYMVGTGYAVREIRHKISALGLQDHITLLGNIHDRERLKKIDAAADLFLFPSLYDNAPLVVREAAAMHTPALMLRESTAAEVINADVNGFLTPNDIHAYAKQITYLMEHPDILQRVGDKASTTISRSWENVIEEVILRYRDIQQSYKFKHGK